MTMLKIKSKNLINCNLLNLIIVKCVSASTLDGGHEILISNSQD